MFEHPYEKINKEDRDIHKYVSKIISQRTYFVFGLDPKEVDYNRANTNYNCKKALFSNRLLRAALLKLVEFIKEYQIKELPEADKVANLIDEYNHRHKTRLPKSEMVGIYRDLLQMGSFKAVAKFTLISRTSLYRYKQRFRKIGITENNLIPFTEDGIPKAEMDLRGYHSEHMFNIHYLIKNNFLNYY